MARPMTSWKALEDVIAGEVVLSGSPAYKELPKPFNARFNDVRPQAIVLCATPQDVSETIAFVRRHGLEGATRSGGHCLTGRSVSREVIIDVTPIGSVSVSGGVATVGAGARLGGVYESLQVQGLAIPAGTCPLVGVAGLTLGGGLRILGRKYGVTSDHLIGAQIVLADGRLIDRSRAEHDQLSPDLAVPPRGGHHPGLAGMGPVAPDELAASLKGPPLERSISPLLSMCMGRCFGVDPAWWTPKMRALPSRWESDATPPTVFPAGVQG